jgi:hypothetical protein
MKKSFNSDLDTLLAGIELPTDRQVSYDTQAEKIRGRKKPNHSKLMTEQNPMQGKVSPNRGKEMPQISKKVKGKKKPEGFGEKISRARKGKPNIKAQGVTRPDHSNLMKDPTHNKGAAYMKETFKCPHCGKTANGPNYKRWHGDNCKMKGKQ